MKKIIALFLAFCLFMVVVGCKDEPAEVKPIFELKKTEIDLELGTQYTINVNTDIEGAEFKYDLSSDIISINGNVIKAVAKGTATVTITLLSDETKTLTLTVNVTGDDITVPTFQYADGYSDKVVLGWNQDFNPLEGITATDNIDGDITSKIQVTGEIDNQTYGKYELSYSVSDRAGNVANMTREVEVVWNYGVTFIGHAGCYYGLMNSEEAFLYAVQVLKYQALECDLKQTKDGVFVLSHDDTFGGYTIASTNYSELKDVTYTAGRKAGIPASNGTVTNSPYTTKICTLERYLEICKEYNAKAVIEVKYSNGINNNDQSRMQALMDEIERCGMRENTILLGSQYNCLIWTRTHGYEDIECQYLVNSCESDTVLQRCKDYDLDISINVTGDNISNSDVWLAKYHEAGLKISTYTYTQYVDYDVVQLWIDKGVDYVTCDWQLMSNLQLPESKPEEEIVWHTVSFYDDDDTLIKTSRVKDGKTAASPQDPTKVGYEFSGWDGKITNVTEDISVKATYVPIEYIITYDANLKEVKETEWASKEEFVDEFYTDFFNWIVEHANDIPEISVTNGEYTLTKNSVTVKFSSKADMLSIDIYDFEKTLSNYIYRPVTRNSDDSCEMIPDNNYFLNTGDYFIKYRALDAWFIKCINTRYTSYDKTYKPLSSGKIQIMFRFHQWAKGTNIAEFNTLPKKYDISVPEGVTFELPTEPVSYTILDEVILPVATGSKTFVGWYLDKELTQSITKIEKGSTGNIMLYAKWE